MDGFIDFIEEFIKYFDQNSEVEYLLEVDIKVPEQLGMSHIMN